MQTTENRPNIFIRIWNVISKVGMAFDMISGNYGSWSYMRYSRQSRKQREREIG